MNIRELEERITKDLAVELADEFDRNFERRAFFDEPWEETKSKLSKGTLYRSGNLRRSIRYSVRENAILFSSSLPYASIHNHGGEIAVTAKMKAFFWAMYYKAAGSVVYSIKKKAVAKGKRNERLNLEAEQWKAFALLPIGYKIKIKQRQFVGNHPNVAKIVQEVGDAAMRDFNEELAKQFRR